MGFEKCHPAVNLLFFAVVIVSSVTFSNPVFIVISLVCSFAYSVKRNGTRAVVFNTVLLALSALFALYYSTYTHFGVTELGRNFIGNRITLESLVYGASLGLRASAAVMWFSCMFSVFTSDKVVYLFGRISPRLSLLLTVLLRTVPKIKKDAGRINAGRRCIGRGAGQGGVFGRLSNAVSVFSATLTRTIDSFAVSSDSMRSRGSLLRGRRAFSIYRFDNRDRALVVALFAAAAIVACGAALGVTKTVYDPAIIPPRATPLTAAAGAAYLLFCIMPLALDVWTEYSFSGARKRSFKA